MIIIPQFLLDFGNPPKKEQKYEPSIAKAKENFEEMFHEELLKLDIAYDKTMTILRKEG